jgi:ferric-dicitrate binding protein FerR (iron transport regulator)
MVAAAAAALVALSAVPRAAPSLNATWLVTAVHGTVTAQRGTDAAVPVATGDRIAAGTLIQSRAGGHVTLMRDGDVVQVEADSLVELAVNDWGGPAKSVVQTIGTASYKVGGAAGKPFKVRTPFITATAVGSGFTVTVDRDRAEVRSTRGAVEVWSVLSGETNLLVAGETAHASVREMMEAKDAEFRQAASAAGGRGATPKAAPAPAAEVPAGFEDAPVLPDDAPARKTPPRDSPPAADQTLN